MSSPVLVEHSIPDVLVRIALRDGISVDEVLTLCTRWIYPLTWKLPEAIRWADSDAAAWQAWRAHHNELMAMGYTWPLIRG